MAITPFTSTDQFDMAGFNGMIDEANEAFPLAGITDPTTSTVGVVGQFYLNTATAGLFQCTGASGGNYTWCTVGGAQFIIGDYIGTGTSGIANPCSITFSVTPKIVILISTGGPVASSISLNPTPSMFFYGSGSAYSSIPTFSPGAVKLTLTWNGNTLNYFVSTRPSTADESVAQYNYTGNVYKWIAFI